MDQVAQDAAENKILVPGGTSGPVWTSGTSGPVDQWSKWQLQVERSFGRLTTQTMCGLDVSAQGKLVELKWIERKVNVTAKSGP